MIRVPLSLLRFFFLRIRRPPRSTLSSSSAASDVYKRQDWLPSRGTFVYYNGQLMGNPVRGKALYDAVLSIWLGDHALEEGLREGLLSLSKEEKEN